MISRPDHWAFALLPCCFKSGNFQPFSYSIKAGRRDILKYCIFIVGTDGLNNRLMVSGK